MIFRKVDFWVIEGIDRVLEVRRDKDGRKKIKNLDFSFYLIFVYCGILSKVS